MVSWDKAKAPSKGGDSRDIERLQLDLGDTKIRLVGEVLPRFVYWITTKEGKKRPVECLSFDRNLEEMTMKTMDPMKEVDPDVFSDKPQFAYVCNVLVRSKNPDAEPVNKLFDLKSTIYKQIVEYASNPDYGNPADVKDGYDFTIKKEKTGPLPQNVKYSVIPARSNSPLTDAEKELTLYDLDKIIKRPTYEDQKKWLMENTSYFLDQDGGDETRHEGVEDLD